MNRCKWVNLKNEQYIKYHDEEWCTPKHDDKILFELLILEMFQAGLSWETILNKREAFRKSFDDFNYEIIKDYNDDKINELLNNHYIIRNKNKILSTINNAKVFIDIRNEFNSFNNYIWNFTNNRVIYENDKTKSDLSDLISKDLKKKGMKFVGTTIIYSYLQSIGIIYSHEDNCFLCKKNK